MYETIKNVAQAIKKVDTSLTFGLFEKTKFSVNPISGVITAAYVKRVNVKPFLLSNLSPQNYPLEFVLPRSNIPM